MAVLRQTEAIVPVAPRPRIELPDLGMRQQVAQVSGANLSTQYLHVVLAEIHHLRDYSLRHLGGFICRLPTDVLRKVFGVS
jgi:hypothetical protein